MTKPGITAIIPCFNECSRIGKVLEVCLASPLIADTVVVNDGSTDTSREVIASFPQVRLVDLAKNGGKGRALRVGISCV